MTDQLTEVRVVMKCDCALKSEGCCSECYDGPVTTLPPMSEEERYKAHLEMEREAHAQTAE